MRNKTRKQAKGYQPEELKHHRDELYKFLKTQPINELQPSFCPADEELVIQFKKLGAIDNWGNWTLHIFENPNIKRHEI